MGIEPRFFTLWSVFYTQRPEQPQKNAEEATWIWPNKCNSLFTVLTGQSFKLKNSENFVYFLCEKNSLNVIWDLAADVIAPNTIQNCQVIFLSGLSHSTCSPHAHTHMHALSLSLSHTHTNTHTHTQARVSCLVF